VLPGSYTHAASRAVAAAERSGLPRWEAEMRRWVLAASQRYGVVIDAATRDHVWVLLRLCLKAAASEARCSLEDARGAEGGGSGFVDPRAIRFECPRLVDAVSWLGTQLRILYGESSGRSFAIAAVREAILRAGSCLAVGVDGGGGSGVEGSDFGNVGTPSVSVAQVAAAIAALHERFSLEEKIKALRAPRPAKFQLYAFSKPTVLFNQALLIELYSSMLPRLKNALEILTSLVSVQQTVGKSCILNSTSNNLLFDGPMDMM
jgi:U11/U12 small nuclear ribonucleoprotein SNRNP48